MVFWKRKDINNGDQLVTELTILEWKRFFSIKLFKFHKTNGKQDRFHTHSFNAISVLLSGDYIEEIIDSGQIIELNRSRKRFLFIPANQYHRITRSTGCRTLLFTGPWDNEFRELRKTTKDSEHYSEDWQIVVCGKHRKSLRSEGVVNVRGIG